MDLPNLYDRASAWTTEKIAGAADQRSFLGTARSEEARRSPVPPALISGDTLAGWTQLDVRAAYAEDGGIERTGPSLGIAFADQLLLGSDLARAGVVGPEIPVAEDAPVQDRLLGHTGRDPR